MLIKGMPYLVITAFPFCLQAHLELKFRFDACILVQIDD
jgi:hypothetical protein